MRSGLVAIVVFTAGCNQFFELDETRLEDRPCAPTPFTPTFTTAPVRITAGCESYVPSTDADLAVAFCNSTIRESAVDSTTMKSSTISAPAGMLLDSPRLAPEGDRLYVRGVSGAGATFLHYTRDVSGAWIDPTQLELEGASIGLGDRISPPSLDRRLLLASGTAITEYRLATTTWPIVGSYTADQLGVATIQQPSLSADGLRLVFLGQALGDTTPHGYFTERASSDDRFGIGRRIGGISNTTIPSTLWLSDGCDRLYFSDGDVFVSDR